MMHVLVHAAREGSCRGEGVTQQETPGHFNTHKHKHTHKHKSSSRTHSHRWWWARRSRSETQRHRDTETQRHRDLQICRHTQTQDTQTHTHMHTRTSHTQCTRARRTHKCANDECVFLQQRACTKEDRNDARSCARSEGRVMSRGGSDTARNTRPFQHPQTQAHT